MELEYYYKNKKYKDEGLVINVTTDSGRVKAVCPKNPLAIWALTYGANLTPVFHMDTTPSWLNIPASPANLQMWGNCCTT